MGTFTQHPIIWNAPKTTSVWEQINLKLVPGKYMADNYLSCCSDEISSDDAS
jgi:hypothetical protein